MMQLHIFRRQENLVRAAIAATVFIVAGLYPETQSNAQVLIGDPFITAYQNWVDPDPARGGNWRVSLHNPTMMETANTTPPAPGAPDITTPNTGNYFPMLLVQDAFVTPANYDLNARMYTSDDDLWGLVFGYQDVNNYYRVGFRSQANGNLGGTTGVSVQKVSNGVITQITPNGPGTAYTAFPTFATSDTRAPVDVKVSVTGSNYSVSVAGENGGAPLITGSDPGLMAGKIGIQSWAQRNRAAVDPHWGTEVETVSVTQGVNTLYSGAFNALPVKWRQMVMTNANGVSVLTTGAGEDRGNFGADINGNYIYQQTNGFENATFSNTDFIGPSVVVDQPGATTLSNYQMQVRMGATDNDGYGVLVRVQDDNNFYRVNFANEAADAAGVTRSPRGLSVQKVRNGTWTELFRDDQTTPLFLPPVGTAGQTPGAGLPMFDVSVGAVGNSLKIQVRDPNGNVISYPIITDSSDPLLTGSVGLTTWGTENVYYSGYGGQDGPLVTTLSAFTDFDVVVNRTTGNITLTNNGAAPVNIDGITIQSPGGGLNPATWTPVANHYDEPPGNGSVDPNDPWTILSSTSFNLSEAEQSAGGDGATIAVGQSINLGNAWVKSRIEDVAVDVVLGNGSAATAAVAFSGGPGGMAFQRSDLNTDGLVNSTDWTLFYPNLLADLSSLSEVRQALAGDLDGDGDNDVHDFGLFKADFDAANGAGAFNAMLANVPEPSSLGLVLLGGLAVVFGRRRRSNMGGASVAGAVAVAFSLMTGTVSAVPIDLTTFTVESFPAAATFPLPIWDITPSRATLNNNADANVLYSPDSALNKRYIGSITPGSDDDVVGFVLGFEPGDAQMGSSADYLLIDWKGANQNFNFGDADIFANFHNATLAGDMPVGLALSRVSGSPTADELWQHADLAENTLGGVTQLARGTTLGSTAYNRAGGSHVFDIRYTPTNVTVLVDGVEQFNVNDSFSDGRFGLYTAWQGPAPTFSNFEVVPADFSGLSAVVDRATGNITLRNTSSAAFDLDYYEIDSASNSLNVAGWNSLSDQNFQATGPGPHQKWQEAGGSDSSELAEAFLQSSTLAGNASISIGNAYNNTINGEDLVLTFRLPTGLLLQGSVSYVGDPPVGLPGDYNGNGRVDAADYVMWRKNPVAFGGDPAGYNTWRANFGKSAAGSGAGLGGASSVPEPSSVAIALCVGLFAAVTCTRQRGA